jgi:hypothetical protein
MSYALEFAPDAQSEWRELDVGLQELVLDELDALASHPPAKPSGVVLLHDLVHDAPGVRHYVFLRFILAHSAEMLTVIGVVHYARPVNS